MATTTVNIGTLKNEIINELRERELLPTELLDHLAKKYPDSVIKEVFLRLLQEGLIEMRANRKLHAA